MATTLELIIEAKDKFSGTFKATTQATSGLSNSLQQARRALVPAIVGLGAATAAGIKFADAASDLNESMNKANVLFGDSAKQVEDFAESAAKSFGLSKRGAFEYTSSLGNILNASGLAEDASADMSVQMTKLAVDLASFNNIGIDEALEKLRAGLVGEAEPLRSVGVLLNAAAVEAKGMELGLADANGELSEAAKVQARYALILEQTQKAQGDFSRTSDSMANQTRIAQAKFEDLQAELGQKLIPVALKALEVFNKFPAELQLAGLAFVTLGAPLAGLIPLLTVMPGLISAIGASLLALSANPVVLTVAGLTALGVAAFIVYQNWDAIEKKLQSLNHWIQEHRLQVTLAGVALMALLGPIGVVVGSVAIITANFETLSNAVAEVVSWINKLISAIKSIPSLPDFGVGGALGKIGGVVPFQHGGVVTRPTLALLGEAGPEAVIPLRETSTVSPGIDYEAMARAMSRVLQGLVFYMDPDGIVRMVDTRSGRLSNLYSRGG